MRTRLLFNEGQLSRGSKLRRKAIMPTLTLRLFPRLMEDENMNEKRPRRESEMMGRKHPNPKACETCMFRPSEFRGVRLDRADTANCLIYEEPEDKPDAVYFDGAECEYYEQAL
jgi:hypothetical protein